MVDYELTEAADQDLLDIAGYTIETWGTQQLERYQGAFKQCFEAMSQGKARAQVFFDQWPELLFCRCEHHYIFFVLPERRGPLILAVFHERMDLINRLQARLNPQGTEEEDGWYSSRGNKASSPMSP